MRGKEPYPSSGNVFGIKTDLSRDLKLRDSKEECEEFVDALSHM